MNVHRVAASIALIFAACTRAPERAPTVPAPVPPAARAESVASADTTPRVPTFQPLPLITWGPAPAGTPRSVPEHPIDLRHQIVRLRLDWNRHALIGNTTLRIAAASSGAPLREIVLDAVGLDIQRVTHRGQSLGFTGDSAALRIALGEPLAAGAVAELTIDYEAVRPERGAYFIDRRRVMWAQGFAEDTRYWVPTVDRIYDKTTWEFYIRVPANERALSNGRLMGTRRIGNGEVEWHWRLEHPASTYLMSVVTGDYVVLRDRWRDNPIGYWTYRDSIEATWRGFGRTPRAMQFFSQWTGVRYPWSKYDQIVTPDFVFGGMENVTATTMSDDAILHPAWAEPRSNADALVAHELAHMWFGDYTSMRFWDDAWLSEGFAVFLSALFLEEVDSPAVGALRRREAHQQTIAADRRNRRPLVYNRWVSDPAEVYFSGHIYPRGASVLQMLRHSLGDSTLRAGINRYLRAHAYGSATSADLKRALEETSGRDLTQFFAQWVYGAGVPAFRVGWAFDSLRSQLTLTAVQVQPRDAMTGLFEAVVDVEVHTDRRVVRQPVTVRGETTAVVITLPSPPRAIRWDAGDWLLDVADFPRPTAMLEYQATRDPDPLGRMEAIDALASRVTSDAVARQAVMHAARRDTAWMVRAHATSAVASALSVDAARTELIAVSRDDDSRVREAAATALGRATGSADAVQRLREIIRSDPSGWVRAAAMRSLALADPVAALDAAPEMLRRHEWRDLARVAAFESLARIRSASARALIISQMDQGARAGRVSGINALLAQASAPDAEAVNAIAAQLQHADPFVRVAAASALGRLGDASALTALRAQRARETAPRVLRALDDAVRRIGS